MKKIFSKIFNIKSCLITLIVIVLLITGAIKFILWSWKPTIYDKPKEYKILKEKIVEQDKIKHFPAEIPADATDIYLYGYTDMPYGGEMILLNFKTNKAFIENELKKNEYWNKNDKIGQEQNIYYVPKVTKNFKEKDYTYYVIKDNDNEYYYQKYFPYFNGVGINKTLDKILYYYICPTD